MMLSQKPVPRKMRKEYRKARKDQLFSSQRLAVFALLCALCVEFNFIF